VSADRGDKAASTSVDISRNAAASTCVEDPGPNARGRYAMFGEAKRMAAPFPGTYRSGLLRIPSFPSFVSATQNDSGYTPYDLTNRWRIFVP
jgi:hypothetical protein